MLRDRASRLAKLTPPRVPGAIPRARLFAALDAHRQRPALWITGPPGAGKTTLAASYLASRQLASLWYQVDAGDRDPATLFYYLGRAARTAGRRRRDALPLLTAEYLADVPGFARRFFRDLFGRLPAPAVLVLDNYQEASGPAFPFDAIIQEAIAEIPAGINLIVTSRADPPASGARHIANHLLTTIGDDQLRLTLPETKAVAAGHGLDARALRTLHAQSQGWVAGVMLMLGRFARLGILTYPGASDTSDAIFHYFAAEVLARASDETQQVLLRTSLLPYFTARMAVAMTGHATAQRVLDGLCRDHWFTERRRGAEVSYQYHALFRAFLVHRAREQLSPAELGTATRRAAELLDEHGDADAAVALFEQLQDWSALSGLVGRQAGPLLVQGRYDTLRRWMAAIPDDILRSTPWLLYWRGISLTPFDQAAARQDLECAYRLFQRDTDVAGLFLSCGGIIDTYFFEAETCAPVPAWSRVLEDLLARHGDFPSAAVEAQVLASLQALLFAEPADPLIRTLEDRARRLMRSSRDPQQRMWLASFLLWPKLWRGEFAESARITAEINDELPGARVSPLSLILWRIWEGNFAWNTAQHATALDKIGRALVTADESGVHVNDYLLWSLKAYVALSAGDARGASQWIDRAHVLLDRRRALHVAQHHFLRAGAALLNGDAPGALLEARRALTLHEGVAMPFLEATNRLGLAQILVDTGDFEGAHEELARVLAFARRMTTPLLEHQALIAEADCWFRQGDRVRSREALGTSLGIAREQDYVILDAWWRPAVIAPLLADAFGAGIETGCIATLVRTRRIRSPSPEADPWPWPITLRTLGRFSLTVDGLTTPSPQTPRKPLELLKCLIACGGQRVKASRIIDALWPAADGDAAQNTFDITLHRMRRLLALDDAVTLHEGLLSLDLRTCQVDAFAFEWLYARAEGLLGPHGDATALASTSDALLDLYRGPFLVADGDEPWIRIPRERLRRKYLRLVTGVGAIHESAGTWDRAAHVYARGLEAETTAEELYRRLMICHLERGHDDAGRDVFDRCRETLAALGVEPTAQTLAVARRLRRL